MRKSAQETIDHLPCPHVKRAGLVPHGEATLSGRLLGEQLQSQLQFTPVRGAQIIRTLRSDVHGATIAKPQMSEPRTEKQKVGGSIPP